jgi:hypothetical protein
MSAASSNRRQWRDGATVLNHVDSLIRKVLDTGWTAAPPPAKPDFFFTVPDEGWRAKVRNASRIRLNIYLYEVRENRDFRRSAPDLIPLPNRTVVASQPPAYFDCHYLLSAWSPSEDSELFDPVQDEHEVLSEAMRVMLRNPDVVPAAVNISDGVVFTNAHVYFTVAPPEPPRVLNDFWSTMKLPWRPAVMLVATAPLDLRQDTAPSPIVTTFMQRYSLDAGVTAEELAAIGGFVVKASDNAPIVDGSVIRLATGEACLTDAQGRYTFVGLSRGKHKFRAQAPGMQAIDRDIDVPVDPPDTHVFKLTP